MKWFCYSVDSTSWHEAFMSYSEINYLQDISDDEMHLYSRHILLESWDLNAQEKLKMSNVLLIGAGGIGCIVAELLARAGIGKLTVIDFDHVEMSNLQRQLAFNSNDLGCYKADVLVEKLHKINPHVTLVSQCYKLTEQNISTLFKGQDLILDACDNFATRYLVNQYAMQLNTPLLSASAIGYDGQLFMATVDTACYQCLFPQQVTDQTFTCQNSGVLSTVPNVIGALQAHHALLYLGLDRTPLKQKLLLWSGLNMTQRIVQFEKDENCLICTRK